MANISVDITGSDKSASSAMNKVGSNAEGLSSKLKGIGSGIGSVFGGIQLSEVADKIGDFAKESVEKLADTANETRNLQRVMGGSSEQVSEFAASANKLGVSQSALVVAMGGASKAIVNGTSVLPKLGIAVKDAQGNYLSMSQLMPEIAEKFKTTQNSTERAALAQDIFGKSGRMLLPVLAQGKDGLADMEDEANKTGLALSGKTMAATYKYQMAQISLRESVEGLQLKLGTALYPQLMKLTQILTSKVLPAIMGFFQWMSKNPAVLENIARVLGPLVAAITVLVAALKIWTVVQGILDVVMAENPIGLIVLAVAALIAIVLLLVANWKTIVPFIQGMWAAIVGFFKAAWDDIVSAVSGGIDKVVSFVENIPKRILGALGDLGNLLKSAGMDLINGFLSGIDNMWNSVTSKISGLANAIPSVVKKVLDIHSPSRVAHNLMLMFGQGLVGGLTASTAPVSAAAKKLIGIPSATTVGVGGARAGSAAMAVTAQTARGAGGVFIGTFNAGGMTPTQVSQELAFRGRWAAT